MFRLATLLTVWLTGFASISLSADWPMWRADAQRSAASEESLPNNLKLLWTKPLSAREPAWDDPLNLDLMTYDRVFEPIVMEGRMFVGFNDRDKLVALDANTGHELWTFYAEAPVRLPPVGWQGHVYFCSDDGFLYCVGAVDGQLKWKFAGAPSRQLAIGNRRLTSAWPARGGPVVRDGIVYFAASIWPFMGTFIYALDAESGKVRWVNDSTGASYIQQPHSAPSFAGVAPQGALVATNTTLLIPGGRSVPAVLDRATGKLRYFEINAGGKGTGGSFLASDGQHFFVHTRGKGTRAFDVEKGVKTAFMPNEPVLNRGQIYSAEMDGDKPVVRCYGADHQLVWEFEADGRGDLILAGNELIAAGKSAIAFIRLPEGASKAELARSIPVETSIERILAADGKLFAVSLDGQISAFGSEPSKANILVNNVSELSTIPGETRQTMEKLLTSAECEGYALWFGAADSQQAQTLARLSPFVQLTIVDSDRLAVDRMRRLLDSSNLYGKVIVHNSEAVDFKAPKYSAHRVFVDHQVSSAIEDSTIAEIYQSVRPYGGVMQLLANHGQQQLAERIESMKLEQALVRVDEHGVTVCRVGALPGSADWTHQYGDVANTIKSDDSRVKLPLGVLWFGGNSNMDVLPRHGHGPPEQVVGGRLFIQGINQLSARDVYTGRVLWQREFDNLETFDVYYDTTYEDVPLDPKYNQVHIPGANGRGTNYVVTNDRIYMLEGKLCHALDPATGETLYEIQLPHSTTGEEESWGYIGVYKDVLIGGLGFAQYRARNDLSFESDAKLSSSKAGFGSKSLDRAASLALVGFDRHTGEQLWQIDAQRSFWHNGIVAGGDKIYCLDKHPKQIEDALKRRGKESQTGSRIVALDYKTGEMQWQISDDVFGTWLGYSEEHDALLQAGAKASDRLAVESSKGMAVYSGSDGSLRWKDDSLDYAGPCILHNDLIITNANSNTESAGAYYLADGKPKLVKNSLTGAMQPWRITRAYGCNSIVASENLLTYRSGAASFYDLLNEAGTGNLGGFKSGCTSNLVVANGVLNAPDYTRTCSCAYQNQTSLALVHMPGIDVWSVNTSLASNESSPSNGQTFQSLAINFGAPGDRRDPDGMLWLEYPAVAGPSPQLSIEMNQQAKYFQQHSSTLKTEELPWVLASGIEAVSDMRIDMRLTSPDKTKLAPIESRRYDVRLFFGAPLDVEGEVREFDVELQGKYVIKGVKLDRTGRLASSFAVHQLRDVEIAEELQLRFVARQGLPTISGIEIIQRLEPDSP